MIHRLELALRTVRRTLGRTALTRRLFAHARHAADGALPPRGVHRRGLVMVQIDGLSHGELGRALERGEMPFLARLLAREGYRCHRLYSGLPSSTPAVQGELFYGVPTAVPAFAWVDRESGTTRRMYDPASARSIEVALERRGEPLLAGGSAYCDIYTGGAVEAHFCASALGWSDILRGARPHAWIVVALLHLPTLARTAALGARECARALGDALVGIARGRQAGPELKFVAARVAIVVLLRDLITIGAKVDIARGLPVVHLNFIGYDEQAHRRGPATAFAHRALGGIDRRIAALWKATHRAEHRHYDLWVYGDHGQCATVPYVTRTGRTIEAALAAGLLACTGAGDEGGAPGGTAARDPDASPAGAVGSDAAVPSRAHLIGARWLSRLFPAEPAPGRTPAPGCRAGVVGMGPIGHVSLGRAVARDVELRRALALWLADRAEVPAVLFVDGGGAVRARVAGAWLELPRDTERLLGAGHPALPAVGRDLLALVRHPEAGDLVLLGWVDGVRALSFARENGAHAGAAPEETVSFALLPEDALDGGDVSARVSGDAAGGAPSPLRPLGLRRAALRALGRVPATSPNVGSRAPGPIAPEALPGTERRLRVMSYNVHSCIGMDGRLSPERIARVIARHAPDIIALQELDVGHARSAGHDQGAAIAALLDMTHRFHPTIHLEEEAYGDAILTRWPVLAHRSGMLPGPRQRRGIEPRGALWVTIDVGGTPLQVLCTHLGLLPGERRVQVAELLSERWLAHPACNGATVLLGDLNATGGSAPLARLRESLVDARRHVPGEGRRATFPSRHPMLAIDHVLLRGALRVERVDVPCTALERVASDHLPLVVELVLETASDTRIAPERAPPGTATRTPEPRPAG